MKPIIMNTLPRTYKNNGQHAEQIARYTLTGKIEHADNRTGADCNGIQIKTSKATICKGLDIRAHVATDGCNAYMYVLADFSLGYIMNTEEYVAFVDLFGHADKDSSGKNHGNVKIRLKTENKAMREWLASHSNYRLYWVDTGDDDFDLWARDYADAETIVASRGYCVSDCIIWGPF